MNCYIDREHKHGKRHPITLHPDWSVTTPHDLEAERIGQAFGSYVSCLNLVEHLVPAAAIYMSRQLRAEVPALRRTDRGRWLIANRVERCCAATSSWGTVQQAAQHIRGTQHIAAEVGGKTVHVTTFARRLLKAWGLKEPVLPPAGGEGLVGQQVSTRTDVEDLWDAGLSPEWVRGIHQAVGGQEPLPVTFYFGTLAKQPDLQWVRDTVACAPDRADHSWLAWTETDVDRADRTVRGRWLASGASRRDIATLAATDYTPEDVARLADLTAVSGTLAAGVLARWVEAGCQPGVADLGAVWLRAEPQPDVVTGTGVDRLAALLSAAGWQPPREAIAAALAICGSPQLAFEVAQLVGSVEPAQLSRGLDLWEGRRITTTKGSPHA